MMKEHERYGHYHRVVDRQRARDDRKHYPILEDEIIDDIGTSPQTIDFMLYGNPDEEVDIIVEGHYWGLCSILELSEEN